MSARKLVLTAPFKYPRFACKSGDEAMTKLHAAAFITFLIAASLMLAACGGGGGGGGGAVSPPSPPPPSGGGTPTWTQNVFQAASTFKDRCQTVRTGVDIEGNPFPDMAGSLLLENFWLRSWTHETYLWNTEVVDRNPASYSNRLDYFDVLRTTATTASGKDKDQFHFSESTADYLEQANSTPLASYGVTYVALSVAVPRDFRVQYTEPNSPASQEVMGQVNLPRGAKILRVDGVDLVNGGFTQAEIDVLNNGLFPATAGENHTFVVQDPGGGERTVALTSVNLAPKPVNRMKVVSTASGDVGYLMITTFNPFSSEQDIAQAMSAMKGAGVSDLVLDLRYNGGGLLAVAAQLGYMVAGDARTNGKTFEQLRFNAAAGNTDPVTGQPNDPFPFFNTGLGFSLANGTPLDTLNLPRVYVLSTDETCSASEAVINSLRGIDVDVVLVGGTTCGKPYGFYPQDNCGETYFTIQFQGVNDKGFGDYADGFVPMNSNAPFGVRAPGCAIPDDYNHELGDESEALLAAALQYRDTGVCPVVSTPQAAARVAGAAGANGLRTTALTPLQAFLRSNRDMRMPHAR
jgi:C-terminal processing protease CtpA/Prc